MFFTTFIKERFWYIVFILAIAYIFVLIRNDLVQNSRLKDEKEAVTKNLDAEKLKQAGLKSEFKMLNKNSYIEMLAREKLGIVQQGEKAYKVILK